MSSGASAVAGLGQSFAESASLRAQGANEAAILERNAGYARQDAQEASRTGDVAAIRLGQQTRQLQGQQRAAAASQGLDVSYGTPADIVAETGRLGALDALTIRNNAARQAFGYDAQAAGYEAGAGNARRTSRFQGRQTLATGGVRFLREMAQGAYAARAAKPNPKTFDVPFLGTAKNPNYRKPGY